MTAPRFSEYVLGRAVCAFLGLALAPLLAGAVNLTFFEARLPGGNRTATVESLDRKGTSYVSLSGLAEQLGGGASLTPVRAKVDFLNRTASVGMNSTEVNGLTRFFLKHRVLWNDGDALIAEADVAAFFEKAFGATVRKSGKQLSGKSREIAVEPEPGLLEDASESLLERPYKELPMLEPGPLTARPLRGAEAAAQVYRALEVIVIDPGHGGKDDGCEGRNGLKEKNVTLAVGLHLRDFLEDSFPVKVVLTREEDVSLDEKARAQIANKNMGDLFITIHGGASLSPGAHGIEIFYPPAAPEPAAQATLDDSSAVNEYALQSREIAGSVAVHLQTGPETGTQRIRPLACSIFADVGMPSMLVEIGCLTNPSEEALLNDDAHLTAIARSIAEGIAAARRPAAPGEATLP